MDHAASPGSVASQAPRQASTDPQPRATRASQKSTRIVRSCLRCYRRKVRCDKMFPCASCARTGVLCSYPGPEEPPRRPHKTTIADVSARLARLERTVQAMSHGYQAHESHDDNDRSISTAQSPERFATPEEPALPESSSNGVLVKGRSSSRYFNEILLSRVLEEVCIIVAPGS